MVPSLSGRCPPGQQMLPQEFVDQFKRERVLRVLAEVVCRVGPDGLTVSLVVREAKVARSTFYELFDNSSDAFRGALELANSKLRLSIDTAAGLPGTWPKRIGNVLTALVATAAEEPRLAELSLVHGCAYAGASIPFDPALVETLAGVLRPGRKAGGPLPGPRTEEIIAFGILAVIAERLRRREPDTLDEVLAEELTQLAVRPFLIDRASPN